MLSERSGGEMPRCLIVSRHSLHFTQSRRLSKTIEAARDLEGQPLVAQICAVTCTSHRWLGQSHRSTSLHFCRCKSEMILLEAIVHLGD